MAEALNWPLKAFREAFQEVSLKGLAKADWAARVILIPKAIRYNEPESPNVIKGWRRWYDEVPESVLKHELLSEISAFLSGKKAFTQAFREAFPEAYRQASPNQEQEQEQEQEQQQDSLSAVAEAGVQGAGKTESAFDRFWKAWPKGARKTNRKVCQDHWKKHKLDNELPSIRKGFVAWRNSEEWVKQDGRFICSPLVWLCQRRWEADPKPRTEEPAHAQGEFTRRDLTPAEADAICKEVFE